MKTETIEIDLEDSDFLLLAKMAHENNITFNQLCNSILRKYMMKELKEDPIKETISIKEFQENFDIIVFNVSQGTHIYFIEDDDKKTCVLMPTIEYEKIIH